MCSLTPPSKDNHSVRIYISSLATRPPLSVSLQTSVIFTPGFAPRVALATKALSFTVRNSVGADWEAGKFTSIQKPV